jgi:hypothetical protein
VKEKVVSYQNLAVDGGYEMETIAFYEWTGGLDRPWHRRNATERYGLENGTVGVVRENYVQYASAPAGRRPRSSWHRRSATERYVGMAASKTACTLCTPRLRGVLHEPSGEAESSKRISAPIRPIRGSIFVWVFVVLSLSDVWSDCSFVTTHDPPLTELSNLVDD